MALIRRAVPCVAQPQPDSALNINWTNPLTRRLGIAVIPWSNQQHVDVLTGHFKKQTYWTQKGTEIGRALYFSGSSADSYISNGPTWAASTEAATLVGVIERFSTGDTTSDDRTVSIRTNTIHAIAIGYSGTNGWYSTAKPTGLTSTLIPGTIDTSVRAVAVARYNPATGEHDLWINGVQVAAATNTPANWQADFNGGGGGTASRSRGYYLTAGLGRWLSDTEVREISRNPWQIFGQLRPFVFDAVVSAGGGTTVAGDTVTANLALIPGAATGAAAVAGDTITQSIALMAGSVSVGTTVAGATVTANLSLIPGAATGAAAVGGDTIAQSIALMAGSVTIGSVIGGDTVTANLSLIPGAATGAAAIGGDTIAQSVALMAGSVTIGGEALPDERLDVARYREIANRINTGEIPYSDGADVFLKIGHRRRLHGFEQ